MGIYIRGLDFYPAMVSRTGTSFQADFIDIPDCHGYGATATEAEANARHALGLHMVTLGRFGRTLPNPSVVGRQNLTEDSYLVYIEGPERIEQSVPERLAA